MSVARAHVPGTPWVLAAVALLAGCSSGAGAPPANAVPVAVASVAQRDVPVELRAIGTVVPAATVAVKSQVEGQLAEIHFQEGQEVQRDDLLFVIDPRPLEAAVREAEAKVAQDRAQAANAATEAARFARLVTSGIVSPDEYEQVQTRAAALASAAAADDAALETARIRLRYATIRSPIDGRVGQLLVHVGNVVKEKETTLAVVNQLRPVHVQFAVPQQELPVIRRHMAGGALPVEAVLPGAGVPAATGELSFVNNTVDTVTGTVLLKAVFANLDEALWPGQFVNVTLHLAVEPGVLVVPARAVQAGQGGPFVYVVGEERAVAPRPVSIGARVGDDVIVTSGLAAGEEVVTDGQLRLAPGSRVEVQTRPPAGSPPPA